MSKKLRKMLGDVNSPSAIELRNLIDFSRGAATVKYDDV